MRSFISVDLKEKLVPKVADLQKNLPENGVKPVKPEALHFTLKFLGNINDAQANKAKNALTKISREYSSISINIRGLGAFPSTSNIRVVWLGVEKNDVFLRLHKDVQKYLEGIRKDRHEPTPHLTIARISSGKSRDAVKAFLSENKDVKIGQMTANKIKLKSSTLSKGGPVYDTVETFNLRPNNSKR